MSNSDYNQGVSRAHEAGLAWLNDVFRFKDGTVRIFRTRVTGMEIAWGLLVGVTWLLVGSGLWFLIGSVWFFDFALHPLMVLCQSAFLGWTFGRKLAHVSPLRRQTGEGMSVWLKIVLSRVATRISSRAGRPIAYNKCQSVAGSKDGAIETDCIEWIGTSRVPRMPDTSNQEYATSIKITPRGAPVARRATNHERGAS